MLNLVTNHLRGRGFQVIEASDGDEALELSQKHRPALVVLDVMMPGMSGWEVCKRLKADRENVGRTGVIMLTGIGESLNDMTSPLFAADAWLDKPFQLDQLDAKIDLVRVKLGIADSAPTAAKKPAPARKTAAKKAVAKKPAAKKVAPKAITKKPAAKKVAPKSTKKVAPKVSKKPAAKKTSSKKSSG